LREKNHLNQLRSSGKERQSSAANSSVKKRKETVRKQQKAPHINQGKGATWEEKPLLKGPPEKKKGVR